MARLIEWDVAKMPLPGQAQLGDSYVVSEVPNGIIIAVVDGLGHGGEAAAAASRATQILQAYRHEGIVSLLRRCHQQLRSTRGVVMSVASIDGIEESLTWAGVGNVEGLVVRADSAACPPYEGLLLRPGVLGVQLPELHVSLLKLTEGDLVILATDGIRADFGMEVKTTGWSPRQIAAHILSRCATGDDDALVLVARYVGREP